MAFYDLGLTPTVHFKLGTSGADTILGNGGNDSLYGAVGDDSLNGGAGNDSLSGGDNNDTLFGGTGNDTMDGGSGNDTFYVDSYNLATGAGDKVTDSAGTDLVITTVSYVLPSGIEKLTLANAGANLTGTGNTQANTMTGDGGNNVLDGGLLGNDSIDGGDGNDTLLGGTGADQLTGGLGEDTFMYWDYAESLGTLGQWDTVIGLLENPGDRIDLSQLDPNLSDGSYVVGGPNVFPGVPTETKVGIYDVLSAGKCGYTGFTWLGSDTFTANAPGQVRYDPTTGLVQVSNDNDAEAEFAIFVGKNLDVETVHQHLILQDVIAPHFVDSINGKDGIKENSGAGTVVYDANTDDKKTTFSLSDDHDGLFKINSITGVVTLASGTPLDYETSDGGAISYTVVATDHAGNSREDVRTLHVLDVNEFAPVISVGGEDAAGADLTETNCGLEASGTLTVTDGDTFETVTAAVEGLSICGPTGGLCYEELLSYFSVDTCPIAADPDDQNNLSWNFDSGSQTFDFLACGDTLKLTYTVKATDNGTDPGTLSDCYDVTITIIGTNAPGIT